MAGLQPIHIIDTHTGGEPTRIVVEGGPALPRVGLAERRTLLARKHDALRTAVINEPRGSDVLVGGLLVEPLDSTCSAGVIFFNNVGYLGMCGHGTIGLIRTLAHLGKVRPGEHKIETPVGIVTTHLNAEGAVTVRNVRSYRSQHRVAVEVADYGTVVGDVAWGGNWFFLVEEHNEQLEFGNVERLREVTLRIREALGIANITGHDGAEIDHIELFGPSTRADSKNFVLCPGGAYDRSPCGTGTSAKLACLVADGKLRPGQTWRQESIVGSVFEGSVEIVEGDIVPSIRGTAFLTAEATLLFEPNDPFAAGFTR